ncbi:unnamed protein product [Clavelina lepadiformis]|uniref:Uncharacterized protein n=1 Tax=Clavelina lepadiformis TaxID=159417 RepID=A0ABP0G9W1_CLALP
MNTGRYGLTAVVLNNAIYAIGGYDGSNRLSSVEKYNLDTKTWIDVPSMNEERSGGSTCVLDGLTWVFGCLGGYVPKPLSSMIQPPTNGKYRPTWTDNDGGLPSFPSENFMILWLLLYLFVLLNNRVH